MVPLNGGGGGCRLAKGRYACVALPHTYNIGVFELELVYILPQQNIVTTNQNLIDSCHVAFGSKYMYWWNLL